MSFTVSESLLVAQLCGEILTATELKNLCRLRGFPFAGLSRQEASSAAQARFFELSSVATAMAALDLPWLTVLHLVAASGEPLSITEIQPIVRGDKKRWQVDWRGLWRQVTEGLLSKGVALAYDGSPALYETSRYARYHLVLPSAFRAFLPPFPIEVEAFVPGQGAGSMERLFSEALQHFVNGKVLAGKDAPGTLAERISQLLENRDGVLSLDKAADPSPAGLRSVLTRLWQSTLRAGASKQTPVSPGVFAVHILDHLPPGSGCSAQALVKALNNLAMLVKEEDFSAFLEEGFAIGLLDRSLSGTHYRPRRQAHAGTPRLKVLPSSEGLTLDPWESDLAAVLQVAAISRISVKDGVLRVTPDPIRMGRVLNEIPSELVERLGKASPAFAAAIERVKKREGQVIVHSGLAVLHVRDVGLHALFCQRFPDSVRDLGGGFLACLEGSVESLVDYARKEGFVARRFS